MPRPRSLLTASLLISALGAPAAEAACPQRPEHAVVAARDVIAAFAAQAPNQRRTELSVACLNAVPTPAQSATIYSANGIIQAQIGDEAGALGWLQAMVEADPAAQLSPNLAPPDHALYALYAQALAQPPSTRGLVRIPLRHTLWVDGFESLDVPLERPALVVLTNRKGEVVWSDLVAPGTDLKDEWRGLRVPLWSVAALVGGAGCVVGYGLLVVVVNSLPRSVY